jgi:hypothetical protein
MSVTDFAEYRLRMRAGGGRVAAPSYYLTGLIHGVRAGIVDRDTRQAIAGAIRASQPNALVHDPLAAWQLGPAEDSFTEFHRLTSLAADSDVCVAWLPTREYLQDAIAELQTAHRAGRTVVAITPEESDYLVRAYATVTLPDLPAFTTWLRPTALAS